MEKLNQLKNWLKREERVVVALSGGIDSTLLALVAKQTLGNNAIAVTGESSSVPMRDLKYVTEFCSQINMKHKFITTNEFNDKEYLKNPENRCYYCKKELFTELTKYAEENNYRSVLDGTNITDLGGHRPGYKAIQEISKVKVPYIELEITKNDIREMARELKLEISEKPASACLASRIPEGNTINPKALKLVDNSENILRDLGFSQIRVRHHGDLARVQCMKDEFALALELRNSIKTKLIKAGYKYVTLDLNEKD